MRRDTRYHLPASLGSCKIYGVELNSFLLSTHFLHTNTSIHPAQSPAQSLVVAATDKHPSIPESEILQCSSAPGLHVDNLSRVVRRTGAYNYIRARRCPPHKSTQMLPMLAYLHVCTRVKSITSMSTEEILNL